METTTPETEDASRELKFCPCCHRPKDVGLVVCWECFKYSTPAKVVPLKYSRMEFSTWLSLASKT